MGRKGWIKLHRRIQDHWIYQEKRQFSRYEAWIDLLMMANHKDNKSLIDGELVTVKKGSLITSIRKLCDKWNWSNTKVNNFLRLLQEDEMITYKSDTKKTVINICNYSVYHDSTDDENDTETTQERQWNIDKNQENVINRKNNGRLNDTEKTGKTVDISSSVMDEHFYKTTQKRHRNDTEAFQEHTNKNDKECIKNDKEIDDDDIRTQEIEKSNSKNDAIVFYQDNFGMLSPYMAEELISWTQVFDDDLLIEAMKRALERGSRNWNYVKRILMSFRNKGITTVQQAKAEEVEFQNQQRARYQTHYQNQKQWSHQRSNEVIPDWFEDRNKPKKETVDEDDSNIIEMQQILAKYKSN